MAGENKWAVMGGITLNVEYTRKYGFDATAAAKVTAKLVAVPPPRLFQEAVQADAIGRTKLRSSLALLKEPELPWFLGEDGDYSGENQAVADELDALEADEDEAPVFEIEIPSKANKTYTFNDGLSPPSKGVVDEDGWLVHPVTPGATRGSLLFDDETIPREIEFIQPSIE